eukprot:4492950-Pyramimonas_sp.AAC.1
MLSALRHELHNPVRIAAGNILVSAHGLRKSQRRALCHKRTVFNGCNCVERLRPVCGALGEESHFKSSRHPWNDENL